MKKLIKYAGVFTLLWSGLTAYAAAEKFDCPDPKKPGELVIVKSDQPFFKPLIYLWVGRASSSAAPSEPWGFGIGGEEAADFIGADPITIHVKHDGKDEIKKGWICRYASLEHASVDQLSTQIDQLPKRMRSLLPYMSPDVRAGFVIYLKDS